LVSLNTAFQSLQSHIVLENVPSTREIFQVYQLSHLHHVPIFDRQLRASVSSWAKPNIHFVTLEASSTSMINMGQNGGFEYGMFPCKDRPSLGTVVKKFLDFDEIWHSDAFQGETDENSSQFF
jgi:hypothetical protein